MNVEPNKDLLEPAGEEEVYFNNTKLVYSSNQECVISNIPVVDPGLPPIPPGTVVVLLNIPGTANGIYEVSADSEYLPEGPTNKLLP